MALNAIKPTSYSKLAAKILKETLVLPFIGNQEFRDPSDTFKVWVEGDQTMGDYVPGTPAAAQADTGAYVDINNPKDKFLRRTFDKNELRKVFNQQEYVDQIVEKQIQARGVQMDTDILAILAGGTEAFAAADAKPTTGAEMKTRIIALETALNKAKAPLSGRYLVVDPDMAALIEQAAVLQTAFGDTVQKDGFKTIGAFAGFTILMSLYLPAGVNMIALHEDSFTGNYEEIEDILLVEVPRGNGVIGEWEASGRIAYNYGILRPTLVQVDKSAA